MADPLTAAPAINPLISVRPLTASAPERDSQGIPAALAGLPGGTTVEGFVINRDPQNNPVLRTPIGDLVIQSDLFLKTGSQVIFRVDVTQASRARIVTIDGLTPSDYSAQQTRAPVADSVAQTPLPTGAPVEEVIPNAEQAPAQPLEALLLSPATPAKAAPLLANPTNVTNPANATNTLPPLPPAAAGAAVPVKLPPALAALPAGSALQLTVRSIQLPSVLPAAVLPQPASTAQPVRVLAQPMLGAPLEEPMQAAAPPLAQTPASTAAPQAPNTGAPAPRVPVQEILPALSTGNAPTVPLTTASAAPASSPAVSPSVLAPAPAAPNPAAPTNNVSPPPITVATAGTPPLPTTFAPAAATTPAQPLYASSITTTSASPPAPVTTAATPLPANNLPMTVIGHEANGATILHSPMGTIQTYLPQKLPVGTQLRVEVTPKETAAAPTAQAAPLVDDSMQELTAMASDWKSLSDAVTFLQASNPPLAAQLTQQLPQIGNQLSSGLLFFLAAVKNGDPKQWLGGRVMAALEAAVPEIAGKLKADMAQLQQFSAEAPKGNWSVVMLPMMQDGQLEQARLFFRHDREPGHGIKVGGANHRFILEVDLSQMGALQLDGFVRKVEQKHQFDLMVRSARPLGPQVSNDIRALFENSVTAAGFNGYLAFQQGSQHFVRPMANVQASVQTAASSGPGSAETNTILA